jgi:hypothetical protein
MDIPTLSFAVCAILHTIDVKLSGQFIVLFCTVLGGISLVRGERPWSDHVEKAFPFEYETKKTQEKWKWKGRLFRPTGFSRYLRSGEKNCRISEKQIDANTIESTLKKAGQVPMTVTSTVSKDGKTRTSTFKGKDAQGRDENNVVVYDKP